MTEKYSGRYVACDIDMTLQAGNWHPQLKPEADRSLDTLTSTIERDRNDNPSNPLFFGAVSGRTIESQYEEVERNSQAYGRAVRKMNLLIGSVGAEMAVRKGDRFELVREWPGSLSRWDRDKAQYVLENTDELGELELQGGMTQSANKLSYFAEANERKPGEFAKRVEVLLGRSGVKATVTFSGGRYLDILPLLANGEPVHKGTSIIYGARLLAEKHNLAYVPKITFAGDSENDEAAFAYAIKSGGNVVIPSNAKREFKQRMQKEYPKARLYIAQKALAAGVHEGLRHFGVLKYA